MRPTLIGFSIAATTWGCAMDAADLIVVDARPAEVCVNLGGDADPRALTVFNDELADYGTWSQDGTFGTVWTPSDADFVPYATDGNFADLDGDLVWVSDVPWGAATLHHGRWVRCHERWRWIPGMKRSGAWVTWKHHDGRTSWTPAAPSFAWRHGAPVPITVRDEPVVGTRSDDELALVPPTLPPQDLTRPTTSSGVHEARALALKKPHVSTIGGSNDDGWDGDSWGDGFGGGSSSTGASFGGSSAHFSTTMTSYSSGGGGHASGMATAAHR